LAARARNDDAPTQEARIMRTVIMILSLLALGACASAPPRVNPGYAAYVAAVHEEERLQGERIASLSNAAASCQDSRCVEHVAALASMAAMSQGHAAGGIAPPAREPSSVDRFVAIAGALSPLASTIVGASVQWHMANTSRDVSIAQSNMLGGVLTHAVDDMSNVAANAAPNITVGGNYVPGTQTNVGGSYIPGTQTNNSGVLGDGNTLVGGNQTNNSGVLGDGNRFSSPNNNAGCSIGGACSPSTVTNPAPVVVPPVVVTPVIAPAASP
jgi:hypothetical protein